MRRLCPALLLCLLLSGCLGGDDPKPLPTPSAQVAGQSLQPLQAGRDVTAPDARYSLRVPADWIGANAPVVELSYRSPDPQETLSITITREELAQIRRPQAYAEAARERISGLYRNVVSLSLAPVQVNGREAWRWTYTATTNSGEFFIYQLFLIDGDEGFVMTGLAPVTGDFDRSRATFDSIAGSIVFARG